MIDEYEWTISDEGALCLTEQEIIFNSLETKTFGDEPFDLSATGGESGNPITFSSSNLEVATIDGNTVTIIGAGETTITASQEGNEVYAAAETSQMLIVNKADQLITIEPIANKTGSEAPFDVIATVDTGLELTYSVNGPATNTGASISLTGAIGQVSVTVNQAGNDNYLEASETTTFMVTGTVLSADIFPEMSYYPNPASNYLVVESNGTWSIEIIDLNGKSHLTGKSNKPIDVSQLRPGMYLLLLHSSNGDVSRRFVKK